MMLGSTFIKRAFSCSFPDMTGTKAVYANPSLEAKRQAAIDYLGEKWILAKQNHIQKKEVK